MSEVEEIIKIRVDRDILDFLKAIYFGDFTNPLKAASSRAYRDMSRTIRFNGLPNVTRLKLREKVNDVFKIEILKLNSKSITSQSKFDSWHRSVSDKIKNIYQDEGIKLTYGHTQKWINMIIKYLYMLEEYSFNDIFEYLHIPVDNYVISIAKDSLGIKRPKIAWSKWDSYEDQYLKYQNLIREKIATETPLRWEFRCWLKAARKVDRI